MMTAIIIAGILGLLAVIVQLALYFSGHIRRIGTEVSERLGEMKEDMSSHLKDSMKIMHETNQHVGIRLENAAKAVGDVREHLGRLEKTNQRLYDIGKDISGLQELLRAPKMRGGIGEYMLIDLLKQILPSGYYTLQHEFKNKERVDATIRFGEGLVPVDAKFPLENFKRMLETKDERERALLKKRFVSDIKNHIKGISEKYIVPDEGTFDFALMYIPAENVYYETIIKDEKLDEAAGLFQYAINKKVIPVSPNSFYAYLRVILLGLKGMAVEKSAKEIISGLSRVRGEFSKFAAEFTKIGRHLDNAKSNYSESEKRLIRMGDKLAGIESLEGAKETAKLPEKK